jgi:hypothetical protein
MLLRSLTVVPAPLASAVCRSCSDQSAGTGVVEIRLAEQLHIDRAINAEDDSHEQVMGVIVRGGPRVRSDLVVLWVGPMVSASRTTAQPVGRCQVVLRMFVPGS